MNALAIDIILIANLSPRTGIIDAKKPIPKNNPALIAPVVDSRRSGFYLKP